MSESQTSESETSKTEVPSELIKLATEIFSKLETSPEETPAILGEEKTKEDATGYLDYAKHINTYVTEYIKLADQKAAFVFAATSALSGYLVAQHHHGKWLKDISTWSFIDGLSFVGMLSLFIGLVASCFVIIPRLHKSHPGFVSFTSIAEHESASSYATAVRGLENHELAESLNKHTYDLSKVCRNKYRALFIGLWSMSVGAVLSIITLL